MNRRDFALGFGTAAATAWIGPPALAQNPPAEGREFTVLKEPVAVAGGKVEVIEFFGYWCPHCASFEPGLDAWARKLPADVNFRRIPIAFSGPQEWHQKLYFAIEAMGKVHELHGKVFTAMHGQRLRMDKESEVVALANANGVDGAKLVETMKSFSVATKVAQARQLAQAYRIDSVPTVAVHGRFITSVGMTGSVERTLQVMDALIQRSRPR